MNSKNNALILLALTIYQYDKKIVLDGLDGNGAGLKFLP